MTQSFWFTGSRLTILADHTTTGGQYDLIEGYNPPGSQSPPHRHMRYSEQIYVLEGELTVWAGKNKVGYCWRIDERKIKSLRLSTPCWR